MSEVRWEVPSSWRWAALVDLGQIVGGGTPPSSDPGNFSETGVPWITPADLTGHNGVYIARGRRNLSAQGYAGCGATILPKGTVLFSSRAPVGYCAVAANEIATNQGFKSLVGAGGFEPEYMRYYLIASREYAESRASGTTFLELSGARMGELSAPVPPLAEQRRIVAKLDALTARTARARADLNRIPSLIARYRDAVLREAFDGFGHQTDERVSLPQLIAAPVRNGLSVRGADTPPGVPALRLSALHSEQVDLSQVRYLPIDASRAALYRLRERDLLVSRGNGTLRLVGTASIVGAINEIIIFPDTAFRIRLDPTQAGERWLMWMLKTPQVREQIEGRAKTTAGIHKISQGDLNALEFPAHPIAEQAEIVRRIDVAFAEIDRLAGEAAAARRLLDRLDQAVLAKAFRGQLVAQDPADEPASALLARIAADRAAAAKAAPKTSRTRAGRKAPA